MTKLIFDYTVQLDESRSYRHVIPFEYSSKQDFVSFFLKLCENAKTDGDYYINPFGDYDIYLPPFDNSLSSCIFTLNEWFDKNKEEIND